MEQQEQSQLESEATEETSSEGWTARDAFFAVGAFFVIIALVVGGYFVYQSRQAPPVDVGSPAPDFSFPLLDGGQASLSGNKGKVVLINIWATWCTPCREEMPSMERLYRNMKGKPFEILAVSIDTRGATDVSPFAKELRLTFPILLDTDKKIAGLYHTTGQPESFIVDKNGVVVDRIIGPLDWSNPNSPQYQLIQDLVKEQ